MLVVMPDRDPANQHISTSALFSEITATGRSLPLTIARNPEASRSA